MTDRPGDRAVDELQVTGVELEVTVTVTGAHRRPGSRAAPGGRARAPDGSRIVLFKLLRLVSESVLVVRVTGTQRRELRPSSSPAGRGLQVATGMPGRIRRENAKAVMLALPSHNWFSVSWARPCHWARE